jgi:hypothetical protein
LIWQRNIQIHVIPAKEAVSQLKKQHSTGFRYSGLDPEPIFQGDTILDAGSGSGMTGRKRFQPPPE